jgi:hypothetical protein
MRRVTIEIHTASFRSTRGYTVVAALCDELAFWPSDEQASPDTEILAAIRPGMITNPRCHAALRLIGRDSIDHPPSGHDDLADVVAGVASRPDRWHGYDVTGRWMG